MFPLHLSLHSKYPHFAERLHAALADQLGKDVQIKSHQAEDGSG